MRTRAVYVSLVFVLLVLSSATGAAANSVTFGLPAYPAGNCIPFGCAQSFGLTNYQQVYAGSGFGGPVIINGIRFFQTVTPGGTVTSAFYALSLSSTTAPVGGLDTSTLANNIGANNQSFSSGFISGSLGGPFLNLTGAPFLFNPSQGNLLLNIVISNFGGPDGFVFLDFSLLRQDTSSTFNAPGGTNAGPLVTEIFYTPATVPEPSTLILLGTGIASVLARRRRSTR